MSDVDMRNSRGARTVPWGTQLLRMEVMDFVQVTIITFWEMFVKKMIDLPPQLTCYSHCVRI